MSLGPGALSHMAPEAREALEASEVVIGYKTYLELVSDLIRGKEVVSSGMMKEIARCGLAIDHALAGRRVALVSSGDAGIYGMAGLTLDLCRERNIDVVNAATVDTGKDSPAHDFVLRVIPGIPAFNAAASVVGAPLMHDFASVSLSDHLTPWELIERRLAAAASADFVIAVYNPRSKLRPNLLEKAQRILLEHLPKETPVAIVRQAMRSGQWQSIVTLGALPHDEVDMQTVLIVGNSTTYAWNGWMVTPRGYLQKYREA